MNRTIIRRVRLTPDESSALDTLLVGTTFSKWVRESIIVATNENVATKAPEFVATNAPTKDVRTEELNGAKGVAGEHKGTPDYVMAKKVRTPIEPTKKVAMDALNKRFEQQMTSAKDTVTTQVKDGRLPKWVVKAERKLMDTTKKELKAIATASTEAAPANIGTLLKAVNQSTCASCSNKIKKGFLCNDCLK